MEEEYQIPNFKWQASGVNMLGVHSLGDVDYKTHRPKHNPGRYRTQFAMIDLLLVHRDAM